MIKSDFGKIEITGLKPVIMVEFLELLRCLRKVLGEDIYNRVLQDANEPKQFESDSETSKDYEKERMKEILEAILNGMEEK